MTDQAPLLEYKIKINIIFSRILDYDEINIETIGLTTMQMVDELNQKYVGLNVTYDGLDIDPDIQNLVFIKISSTFYSSTHYEDHLSNIGATKCRSIQKSFDGDTFLEEYFIEKMNFSVFEIVTSRRVITGK